MRSWSLIVYVAALSCLAAVADVGDTPFVNLDFERAVVREPYPYIDTTARLIPGWTLTFDGKGPYEFILVGYGALGTPTAWVADRRSGIQFGVIQGRFSLVLTPGFNSPSEPHEFAHYGLSQTGKVPSDAQALRFQGLGGVFDVRMNGLSLDLIDESPNDLWYATDVRQFAGQTVLLEFVTTEGPSSLGVPSHVIDSIEFSPVPVVPEPSPTSMLLSGLCGFLLLYTRRK